MIAGVSLALVLFPVASRAGPLAVSFDQVEKMFVDASLPADDGFDAQSAEIRAGGFVDESYPAPATNPMLGILDDPAGYMARSKAGTLRRYSFMGSASRVDDLISRKTTIAKPDVQQVIYLDLALKTYRAVVGDAAKRLVTLPSTLDTVADHDAYKPEATGQATILVKTATHPIGPRNFGTRAASGYKTSVAMSTANSTGSCPAVAAALETTTFLDERSTEPESALGTDYAERLSSLSMRGCKVTYEREVAGTVPPGFILYRLSKLENAVPRENVTAKVATLLERANVTPLTDKDESLFEIPPGFTPEANP